MNSFEKADHLLCKALEEVVSTKNELSTVDLDNVYKILSAMVMNNSMMEKEEQYSRDYRSYDGYSMRSGYPTRMYNDGRYSNEYSRHDSKQAAMDKLNGIFETSQDPEIRDAVMLAMNKLNK